MHPCITGTLYIGESTVSFVYMHCFFNKANQNGGSVALYDISSVTLNSSIFESNIGTEGGAMHIAGDIYTTISLNDLKILHNRAKLNGGIYII